MLLMVCVAIISLRSGDSSASETEDAKTKAADFVCGPRCVQYVLRHFGLSADLSDLIHEMQWPEIERGTNLVAIQEALQKRGVFTRAVRVGTDVELRWPHPVIVHLSAADQEIGHFVVQLPSDEPGNAIVWIGLDGWVMGDKQKLAARRSGFVLLTAPEPILDPMSGFVVPDSGSRFRRWGLILATALATLALSKYFLSRRAKTRRVINVAVLP
jgi:Peptidase C39 family